MNADVDKMLLNLAVVTWQIFTNGYVTFGLEFDSRNPIRLNKELLSLAKRLKAKKRGMVMMAPLWTDNDATQGDVFYHIYDLDNAGSTATDMARVQVCTGLIFWQFNYVIDMLHI